MGAGEILESVTRMWHVLEPLDADARQEALHILRRLCESAESDDEKRRSSVGGSGEDVPAPALSPAWQRQFRRRVAGRSIRSNTEKVLVVTAALHLSETREGPLRVREIRRALLDCGEDQMGNIASLLRGLADCPTPKISRKSTDGARCSYGVTDEGLAWARKLMDDGIDVAEPIH